MLAKTDRAGIARDLNNQALLSTDITVLNSHREEYRRRLDVSSKLNDINIMKEQITELLTLRDELQELKVLLYNHIQRENKCLV